MRYHPGFKTTDIVCAGPGGTVLMEYWTCCDATVREYGTTSSGKFDIHTPVRGCKVCKRLRKRTDDAEVE